MLTGEHHTIVSNNSTLKSVGYNSLINENEESVLTDKHGSKKRLTATERRDLEHQLVRAERDLRLNRLKAKTDPSLRPVVRTDEKYVEELRARLEPR